MVVWKAIEGYKYPYRVSTEGEVQKRLQDGSWKTLSTHLPDGNKRVRINLRSVDNELVKVPLSWIMADAFMGGPRMGMNIIHKNGMKTDFRLENLAFEPNHKTARRSCRNRRRPVVKLSPDGEVLEAYGSVKEATKANYFSRSTMQARLHMSKGRAVQLDGFYFEYEK